MNHAFWKCFNKMEYFPKTPDKYWFIKSKWIWKSINFVWKPIFLAILIKYSYDWIWYILIYPYWLQSFYINHASLYLIEFNMNWSFYHTHYMTARKIPYVWIDKLTCKKREKKEKLIKFILCFVHGKSLVDIAMFVI